MLTITTPTLEAKRKGLTHTRLQQVLGYTRIHLDSAEPTLRERDLPLTELAEVINIARLTLRVCLSKQWQFLLVGT